MSPTPKEARTNNGPLGLITGVIQTTRRHLGMDLTRADGPEFRWKQITNNTLRLDKITAKINARAAQLDTRRATRTTDSYSLSEAARIIILGAPRRIWKNATAAEPGREARRKALYGRTDLE